jgi:hypothetical protein
MEYIPVTTALDSVQASMLKGLLESAGIATQLSGGNADLYPGTALAEVKVLVRDDDLDKARAILDQIETVGLDDEDDEE